MFKKYAYTNNVVYYQNLIRLAIPMAMTALLNSLVNMIDTYMISKLGPYEVAAVGSSNKIFLLLIVTLYGVYSGFGVFISQYWGKKDLKHLQTVYMTAIITGFVISTFVTVLSFAFPEMIIDLFIDEKDVIDLGARYLKLVSISFIISAIIFSFEMVSRSTEKVMLPFFVSFAGVIFNGVLNYVLIFGHFGFKEMGVEGAAIATNIARFLQLLIYMCYIMLSKNPVMLLKIKNYIFDPALLKKVFQKSLPVMGNEFFWALGIIAIFAAYGRKGYEALASMQLFETVVGLLTVFTMGIANSSAIMIGKKIGEKAFTEAKWYAKLFIFNSIRFGIITGFILILSIPVIPIVFKEQGVSIIQNIQYCIFIFALYMPFNLLAVTFMVGILRSGGDTKAAFLLEFMTLWFYAVPMSFILVTFTDLSIPLIYLIITFELIIKDTLCYIRYRSGKYLHNLIH